MSMLGSITQLTGANVEAQRPCRSNRRAVCKQHSTRWLWRALDILESDAEEALELARTMCPLVLLEFGAHGVPVSSVAGVFKSKACMAPQNWSASSRPIRLLRTAMFAALTGKQQLPSMRLGSLTMLRTHRAWWSSSWTRPPHEWSTCLASQGYFVRRSIFGLL